jgi:hypothetical protein
VVEREAPGDFDYLLSKTHDAKRDAEDNLRHTNGEPDDGHFDAFNADTWSFTPTPNRWYRGTQAMTAVFAAAAALVAIVVSGVLLVFRGSTGTVDHPTPVSQPETATATSAAPTTADSSVELPPPAPTPPPPESVVSSVNTAPTYNSPSVEQPATKQPEIGVTHTPITRTPLSVAPQPRRAPTAQPPTGSHHG